MEKKLPDYNVNPFVAITPVVILIVFLALIISLFGSDSLSGGSQVALLMGMAVCVTIAMMVYKVPWRNFESRIMSTIGEVSVTLLLLL